jgi:hypothetical protein
MLNKQSIQTILMSILFINSVLSTFYCSSPTKRYSPPEKQIHVLVLPFQEKEMIGKPIDEMKKSNLYPFGFAIADSLAQVLKQREEMIILDTTNLFRSTSVDQLMEKEKIKYSDISIDGIEIDFLIAGTYHLDKDSNTIFVSAELIDHKEDSTRLLKKKEIIFTKNLEITNDKFPYEIFLRNQLAQRAIQEILCKDTILETCTIISQDELNKLQISETKNLQSFLQNGKGLQIYYESLNPLIEDEKKISLRKKSIVNFKQSMLTSQKENENYESPEKNLYKVIYSTESEFSEINTELQAFTISSYTNSKDPLKNGLNEYELQKIRGAIAKAIHFIQLNPNYMLEITGHWTSEKDNLNLRAKNSRSQQILEQIAPKTEEGAAWKKVCKSFDKLSDEDKVEFQIVENKSRGRLQ